MTRYTNPSPLSPLSFATVNESRHPTSCFPIFTKLPSELYHAFTSQLTKEDLESLALVDRDCLQLSRSVQFVDVELKFDILVKLVSEVTSQKDGGTLGSCIRRVRVINVDGPSCNAPMGGLAGDAGMHRMIQTTKYYESLSRLLQDGLPNLTSFEWKVRGLRGSGDTEALDALRALARRHPSSPSVRDLSLNLGDSFPSCFFPKIDFPNLQPGLRGVETLVIDISSMDFPFGDWGSSPSGCGCFMVELLRSVSGTLRSLTWISNEMHQHHFGGSLPVFPNLREVRLEGVEMSDSTLLDTFLGENTRVSSAYIGVESVATMEFFERRGYIASLKQFGWSIQHKKHGPCGEERTRAILPFLSFNDQLEVLGSSCPLAPHVIEEHLLPMFSARSSFLHLTSLRIVWSTPLIFESSLRAVASLTFLRRLWISSGTQEGWRTDWRVDHESIADSLQALHRLQTLVITRDGYEVRGHPLLDGSPERYYGSPSVLPHDVAFSDYLVADEVTLLDKFFGPTATDCLPFEQARDLYNGLLKTAWERWHRERMVKLVDRMYMGKLVSLKRCFVGQYWVGIEGETVFVENSVRHSNSKEVERRWLDV